MSNYICVIFHKVYKKKTLYIVINGNINAEMRDTVELAVDRGQEPVEFWFGKYLISVRFNSMLLEFDADIYKSDTGGNLNYFTTIGGKTQGIALQRAKDIVLEKV